MDHNNSSFGLCYSGATTHNTWVPPPSKRRAISESDCDDVYSESSKDHISNGESDSCQILNRKKRRGVIEKKRRDRINTSLSELKRLVPTAYEKQGSAKLEKAEILQLTVDHLKNLHSKGIDSLSFDSQRFAIDYHIIGFKECAAEVARYLVTIEGMDIQDPLRLRLLSHLQCFVSQRELTSKSAATSPNPWVHGNYQTTYPPPPPHTSSYHHQHYPPSSHHTTHHHHQQQQQQQQTHHQPSSSSNNNNNNSSSNNNNTNSYIPNLTSSSTIPIISPLQHNNHSTNTTNTTQNNNSQDQTQQNSSPQQQQQHSQQIHYSTTHDVQHQDVQQQQQGPTYTDLSSSLHRGVGTTAIGGYVNPQYPTVSAQGYIPNSPGGGGGVVGYNSGNGMKPYRPWGAEMAY